MKYLKPGHSHCKDLFPSSSPLLGVVLCQCKMGQIHQETHCPWGAVDSGSCLPIPSGCQKCCSASQLFSLGSAIALAQSGLKHQAHLVCPSLQPGLVPSYYLVSSLMPSNICLIFYAAFLVVLRGRDYPYCLDFLLQKPKSMACLKKENVLIFLIAEEFP